MKSRTLCGTILAAVAIAAGTVTAASASEVRINVIGEKSRDEIVAFFADNVFGRRPAEAEKPPLLKFEKISDDKLMPDGKMVRKQTRIVYGGSFGTNSFPVTAFVPADAKGPVPAFLLICNRPYGENCDPERRKKSDFFPVEEIVKRGFAAVSFYNWDIAPDYNTGNTKGVFEAFEKPGPYRNPKLWGTISAWAWGASRALDWLETVHEVDAAKVVVVGHSRGGKTALWTTVSDTRFAGACVNCSGCAGAKLNHLDLPESEHVAQIVRRFQYWFCLDYTLWANREREMPFDQHELLSCVAPRLLAVGSGTEDHWAGPEGERKATELASAAWEDKSCVSYHCHNGNHDLVRDDWNVYLAHAERHWKETLRGPSMYCVKGKSEKFCAEVNAGDLLPAADGRAKAVASFGATEKVALKTGWRFVKGDDPAAGTNLTIKAMSDILDCADRGDVSGAPSFAWAEPEFDDSSWKEVRVPHDWGVEKPFDSDRAYGDAFLDVTGVGWYRYKLKIENGKLKVGDRCVPIPAKGVVMFECDGAMSYAMLYVNGSFAGGWPYGYTRWRVDITRWLSPDDDNTLAIRCHNVKDSSRWYTGGGLYRNCRLLVCPEDHVLPGSVFITTPEVTAKRARVRVRYEMSKSGKKDYSFVVENPRLWDIDDPYLHTVDIEGNAYRYGIRTMSFNADERRFQLNGRTVPLNGVSMHHDFGVLGAAWNRAAQRRRLLLFKEAGVNAIRSSHNPPDEGLLELCDELGLLVKDEVFDEWRKIGSAGKRANGYTKLFDVWHERDLRAWVRTDRNHPCVIMYSVGNEICDLQTGPNADGSGTRIARELARMVAEEDNSRPTTNANNNPVNYTNDYPTALALMGCNYYSWQYPALSAKYPDVPFFATESVCMSVSRGEYHFPVAQKWGDVRGENFHNSSYCWEAAGWSCIDGGWACAPDAQWYWMDRAGTCMGEFIWTGIDYLGGPYWCDDWRKKPHFTDSAAQARAIEEVKERGMTRAAIHTCNTGFLDQAGFKKDSFWLFQSRWRPDFPMAHILPHWNWKGREGEVTPVYVFTSGDEGELFLNGKSLGRQRKQPGVWDRAYRLRWDDVRYEPGVLEVVVYKDGREWARDMVKTTGAPARLEATAETAMVASDGEDVCYVNVSVRDAEGMVVPDAKLPVKFEIEGPGEIVATDNGDETDFDDYHSPSRRTFNGWVQAIVRAHPGSAGNMRVRVSSVGLAPSITLLGTSPSGKGDNSR